jgi:hypothetical protein
MNKGDILYEFLVKNELALQKATVNNTPSILTIGQSQVKIEEYESRDGVSFSFYRFGLGYTTPDYRNYKYPAFATIVPSFNYMPDGIREGYIYVYYEKYNGDKPTDIKYEEFLITKKNDVVTYSLLDEKTREPVKKFGPFVYFNAEDIVWLAYSEYKWHDVHLKNMMNNESCMKKRFQKLDVEEYITKCKQFARQSQSWGTEKDPQNSAYTVFYNYSLPQTSIEAIGNPKQDVDYKDDNEPFLYYFTLHDPIGAVDDIISEIVRVMGDYEHFMKSLPLPPIQDQFRTDEEKEQYESLFQSALLLKSLFYSDIAKKNSDFNKYRDIIDKERLDDVLGGKERQEFIYKIRGGRKKEDSNSGETVNILGLRDSLGYLIFSNYYQSVWCDLYTADDEILSIGQARICHHMEGLLIDTEDVDFIYSIGDDVPDNNWKNYIMDTLPLELEDDGDSPKYLDNREALHIIAKKVLEKHPILPGPDEMSSGTIMAYAVGQSFLSMATLHLECFVNGISNMKNNLSQLKARNIILAHKANRTNRAYGVLKETNTAQEIQAQAGSKAGGQPSSPNGRGNPIPLKSYPKTTVNHVQNKNYSYSKQLNKGLQDAQGIKITHNRFEASNEKLSKALDHSLFKGFFMGLNVLNCCMVLSQIYEQYGTNYNEKSMAALELWFYTAGSTLQLGSSWYGLARNTESNVTIAKKVAEAIDRGLNNAGITQGRQFFTNMVSRGMTSSVALGLGGSSIFAIISIIKGIDQLDLNNKKAGQFNIVSGIAGGLNVIFTIVALSTAQFAFTLAVVNLVLFIIAVLFVILAAIFTLNFLESFLTCTVFNKERKIYLNEERNTQSVRYYLYEYRKVLTETYNREEFNSYKRSIEMSDFQNMQEWLINLVVNFQGNCRLSGWYDTPLSKDYQYASSAEFKLRFSYFNISHYLEVHFILYPKGIEQRDCCIIIPSSNSNDYISRDEDGFYSVEHRFRFDHEIEKLMKKQKESEKTEISLDACSYILFARIVNEHESSRSMDFPYCKDSQERYIAFHEKVIMKKYKAYHQISKYSGPYRADHDLLYGRNYYSLSDSEVLVGTKEEIYKQIKPLELK